MKIDIEDADEEAVKPEEATAEEETGKEVKEETGKEAKEEAGKEADEESKAEDAGDKKDEASDDKGGKKKHSKKNKKDPRDEKIEELEDRVKRQMAEFENFRKRTDKEKSQMFDMGAKAVIEKILPVIDNFERGLESVPEGADEAFSNGMKMIYKQMTEELDKLGVKAIEAVGKEFDPNIHNAVMQVESEEYESGIVAHELQKG
ncbi:MAG: nucleotide exchange factor GrpE [Lachnospiraceae bacterium]|nr:nucleotide exchange factor GrpE [Lachnospiraceae bacterium]